MGMIQKSIGHFGIISQKTNNTPIQIPPPLGQISLDHEPRYNPQNPNKTLTKSPLKMYHNMSQRPIWENSTSQKSNEITQEPFKIPTQIPKDSSKIDLKDLKHQIFGHSSPISQIPT